MVIPIPIGHTSVEEVNKKQILKLPDTLSLHSLQRQHRHNFFNVYICICTVLCICAYINVQLKYCYCHLDFYNVTF